MKNVPKNVAEAIGRLKSVRDGVPVLFATALIESDAIALIEFIDSLPEDTRCLMFVADERSPLHCRRCGNQREHGDHQVMKDETEDVRRSLVELMPLELQVRVDAGEKVWTLAEMIEEFSVDGFMAPYVVVIRKADGVKGTLMFTHSPRYYFGWDSA